MVILGILCLLGLGTVWYLYRGELAQQKAVRQEWLKESMLTEAEGVIMDFLDYGREVSLASKGKYRGTISLRMHPVHKGGELGFCISMYDCGDLARVDENVLDDLHLTGFVKKYGYYFDPERDAVVYQTSSGAQLAPGEREMLTRKLMQRIRNHPLAIIKSETMIGTKGLAK